jgi:hypothetical protein
MPVRIKDRRAGTMSFIHDLGQKLGRAAQHAGKKTGEWVSGVGERTEELATVGKLNVEIGRLRAEIKQMISQLGEAAYAAYADGHDWSIACGPICREIQEKHNRIAGIEAEVSRIREESDRRAQAKKEKAAARKQEKAARQHQPATEESPEQPEMEEGSISQQAGEEIPE